MDQIRLPSAQLSHRKGQEVAGPAWLQCSYRWDQAQSHGSRRGSCLRSAWPFEDALYLEALKEAKCKQMPQADPHKCSCADKSDTSICLKKTNPNSQMDHFHRKNAPLTALPSLSQLYCNVKNILFQVFFGRINMSARSSFALLQLSFGL